MEWAAARQSLKSSTISTDRVQHSHWDWRNKTDLVSSGVFGLMVVTCDDEIQSILAHRREPCPSMLDTGSVVYIDYLESAPWNLRIDGRTPRFGGAGLALLVECVRLSLEWGLSGRIGLHSLEQAESFYVRHGLVRIGHDPDYYDLVRYELTDDSPLVQMVLEEKP